MKGLRKSKYTGKIFLLIYNIVIMQNKWYNTFADKIMKSLWRYIRNTHIILYYNDKINKESIL